MSRRDLFESTRKLKARRTACARAPPASFYFSRFFPPPLVPSAWPLSIQVARALFSSFLRSHFVPFHLCRAPLVFKRLDRYFSHLHRLAVFFPLLLVLPSASSCRRRRRSTTWESLLLIGAPSKRYKISLRNAEIVSIFKVASTREWER